MLSGATLAEAAKVGALGILAVTAVLLLVVGAIFWSFLRRASKDGVSPLEVDLLDPPHVPEPSDPTVISGHPDVREDRR